MESVEIDSFADLFEDGRINAAISWLLFGFLGLVLLESVLDRDLLWIAFTAATVAVVLLPPLVRSSPYVMLPWELLLVALLPIAGRALALSVGSHAFATYLSIAALALIVVAELHVLDRVQVTHWFAVLSVVMVTLAAGGVWAVVRWTLDRWTASAYLTTNDALMVEFAWVLAAGVAAGILFDLYFRRRSRNLRRSLGRVIRR